MENKLRFETGCEEFGTVEVGFTSDGMFMDGSKRLFLTGLNTEPDKWFEELVTVYIPNDPPRAYGTNAVYLNVRYLPNLCGFFESNGLGEFSGHIGIYGNRAYPLYFVDMDKILHIESETMEYFRNLKNVKEGENNESGIIENSKVS